ncbi:hypothetical protein [Streptomyces europaeiscabiei]|uniref:hypothetical protein n=1 Tax=Streptomyces europaeiscabiei TaxID=146819 RepID=UPI000E67B04C|nr:hypothetical protein [Streptomyces europaeiscabiei]
MTVKQEQATQPEREADGPIEGDDASVPMTQERTIELLLKRSKRANRTVPIRRTFLQEKKASGTVHGPLRSLVANRQERALDLYLLVAAVTSGGDYSVTDWSATWARTIGVFDEKTGASAVSRAWKPLKELDLIATARGKGRRTTVTKLLEDGTGSDYAPPGTGEAYLQLPFEYWERDLHLGLSLPGKAMYLIALAQRRTREERKFPLVHARISQWYGLAERTVANGIKDLIENGVMEQDGFEYYETLAHPTGRASRPLYALREPFHHRGLPASATQDSSE